MTAAATPTRKREKAGKEEEVNAAAESAKLRAAWPYRFELVPLGDLTVDSGYQRPLTPFWVEVRDNFDPALVGTLIVSERTNGIKSVIDGQTRLKAMGDVGVPAAPCLIYTGLTRGQEAELFAALQRQRRGMRTYHRFRAELVAKKEQAVGISRIAGEVGFELGREEKRNTLQSITALEKAYRIDPEHLKETLEVIRDSWAKFDDAGAFAIDDDAVSAQIINGVSTFIRKQERLELDRLVDRLQDVTPRMLMNKAAAIREGAGAGTGAAGAISQAILNEYMRRKRAVAA
jgi:hypothetical protein